MAASNTFSCFYRPVDVDIAGAPWVSILVKTGVFRGPGANSDSDPADIVVDHVADAVQAALHRNRYTRWHSLR